MSISTLKEFKAITDDDKSILFCAATLHEAAAALETGSVNLVQISVERASVQVEIPDAKVRFSVTVTPSAAVTASCVAMPQTFLVDPGSKIIAQAVAAGGYTFSGWYRGITLLSSDPIAELTVVAPTAGASEDVINAKFTLA